MSDKEIYTSVRQYDKILSNRLASLTNLMWEAAFAARGDGSEDKPTYGYAWAQRWSEEFEEKLELLEADILKLINRQYDDALDLEQMEPHLSDF